VECKHLGNR